MATQTLSTADAVLKDLYRGPIIEQTNYKTFMLDMIERDSESIDFTGRRAIFPTHMRGNPSSTSHSEGGTLATPGAQTYLDAIVAIRDHNAGMEITDKAIKLATSNEGAFVNLLDNDTKLLAKDFKKKLNTDVFGDGTGLLATLTSSPAGATTFTVDSRQRLAIGQVIDVLNKTTGAAGAAGVTITAINTSNNTITVDTSITATTSTFGVYKEGSRNNTFDGLQNITGTSRTLHSINSATAGNEAWNGFRRAASGATVGEDLIQQLLDDIGGGGNGEADYVIQSRPARRRLAATYQSQKRFNDAKATEIHGGYTAIWVNETPVIIDDDVPRGWTFALSKDAFKWAQVDDPDWLQKQDGQIWHLKDGATAGKKVASWQAWWVFYAALVCVAPNRTGAIPDGADDTL
jgi:hypothetical protein